MKWMQLREDERTEDASHLAAYMTAGYKNYGTNNDIVKRHNPVFSGS